MSTCGSVMLPLAHGHPPRRSLDKVWSANGTLLQKEVTNEPRECVNIRTATPILPHLTWPLEVHQHSEETGFHEQRRSVSRQDRVS
jgi:hypothetical protein